MSVISLAYLTRKWCHNNKHFAEFAPRAEKQFAWMWYEEITSLSAYVWRLV